MDWADDIMTTYMLQAEQSIMPSKCALSHSWLPALVLAQKKKGQLSNLICLVHANHQLSPCTECSFCHNASAIDPTWKVPTLPPSNIQQMAHDTTKLAKKLLHEVILLWFKHLDEWHTKMVDKAVPAEKEQVIKRIMKLEHIRNKHRWLKTRNAPLTFVVDTNGSRKTNWENDRCNHWL